MDFELLFFFRHLDGFKLAVTEMGFFTFLQKMISNQEPHIGALQIVHFQIKIL